MHMYTQAQFTHTTEPESFEQLATQLNRWVIGRRGGGGEIDVLLTNTCSPIIGRQLISFSTATLEI